MFRIEATRELRGRGRIGIGFVKSSVFSFERRGFVEFVGWIRYCPNSGGSLFQRGKTALDNYMVQL